MSKRLGKLAKRYARAFLGSIEQSNAIDSSSGLTHAQVAAEGLISFSEIWSTDPRLASVVLNPMFDGTERVAALEAVANAAKLPAITIRFLKVLFERDRISALPEIAETFAELADEAAKVVPVSVTTAREVDAGEKRDIEGGIAQLIEGTPAYSWTVDPSILGGLIISYRGKMIDGSIAGRLEAMEKALAG